jgi:hypothetical protein
MLGFYGKTEIWPNLNKVHVLFSKSMYWLSCEIIRLRQCSNFPRKDPGISYVSLRNIPTCINAHMFCIHTYSYICMYSSRTYRCTCALNPAIQSFQKNNVNSREFLTCDFSQLFVHMYECVYLCVLQRCIP